jgi:hypothetical protein
MPKMVSPLAQGNAFARSADGGQLADTATRTWKVILNEPNESWDIGASVGVQIGDPYSDSNPIPCVSVEARADGESRLVRIVTAQYRTNAGGDDGGGQDPGSYSPDVRPANFSTSTTLYEMPAYSWKRLKAGFMAEPSYQDEVAVNSAGDRLDGVTKFEPITTIRVTQFSQTPGTTFSHYCGHVNSEEMNLGSYMTCAPHTVMFRGVEAAPHVESFGNMVYRGFMNSYEFAYRVNKSEAPGASGDYGWDLAVPVTGFTCRAFNPANPRADQDPCAVPLQRWPLDDPERPGLIKVPLQLQDGVAVNERIRALVRVAGRGQWADQAPCAQPVALNEDGTPRSENADPKIILWRVSTQPEINLTQTLQLRLT